MTTAATLLPSRLLSQVAVDAKPRPIPDHGTLLKFRPDGTPRLFAGNTVICHLPAQCAVRDAMVTLREALSRLSLHGWPSYLALEGRTAGMHSRHPGRLNVPWGAKLDVFLAFNAQ